MNTVRSRLSDRSWISSSKAAGADRVEARGRLVEEQQLAGRAPGRGPGRRACSCRPTAPTASARRRRAAGPTRAIFRSASSSTVVARQLGVLEHRRGDVLLHRQVGEQRALLEQHAPAPLDGAPAAAREACSRFWPKTCTSPPSGSFRPMRVLSSTDLPAPEPPTTPQHLAALDGQVEVLVDHDARRSAERRPAHLDRVDAALDA